MLFSPEDHPHNAPETWTVQKAAERCWQLRTKDGGTLQGFKTKRAAEAAKVSGFYVTLYEKERRWYAGEHVHPWRPFADVQREQEARRARQREREAG